MYLRHTTIRKDGKTHRYWRLVRSVRVGRRVIQQTVAHLGELDEQGRVEARALARRLIGTPEQARLFNDGSTDLTVPVRLKGIRIERARQFGDVYLALALWRGTGLEDLCGRLLPIGKERIAWAKMAAVLVAARFCEPSSELHIAEDWYRRTALSDPHSARCPAGAQPPATSCLGAFWTPAAIACGKVRHAGLQKPAQQATSRCYSATLSTRASSVGGAVRSNALAVLRLKIEIEDHVELCRPLRRQ
jgi:hypothetical protein